MRLVADQLELSGLDDAAARHQSVTSFDRPLVVEAGAGTGKTAVLVARIVYWCLGPGWCHSQRAWASRTPQDRQVDGIAARVLERVVAITFTERAAAEIQQRIAAALGAVTQGGAVLSLPQVADQATIGQQRFRAQRLLQLVGRVNACTFHAYCLKLLRRFNRGSPDLEVDAEGSSARRIATELVLEGLHGRGDPDVPRLVGAGFSPQQLVSELLLLAQRAVSPSELGDGLLSNSKLDAATCRLGRSIQRLVLALTDPLESAELTALGDLQRVDQRLSRVASTDELQRLAVAVRADGIVARLGRLVRKRRTSDEAASRRLVWSYHEFSTLLRSFSRLQPLQFGRASACYARLLLSIYRRLEDRGECTFSQLGRGVAALLGDDANASKVRNSIDTLLIDEFQDTDPIQYEIVRKLALCKKREDRPSLFLVGDPKQSIYGWRDADLSCYEQFAAEVEADGGRRLSLSVNFRSTTAILAEVRRIFEPTMRAEPGLQPAFQLLTPGHSADSTRQSSGVEYWLTSAAQTAENATRLRELEAAALAADLASRNQSDPNRQGSTAVLLRTTSAQGIYVHALQKAGVSHTIEKDDSLHQQREVIDAISILRAVIDPGDHVALVGFLRSAVVGVPDFALGLLWEAGLGHACEAIDGEDSAPLVRGLQLVESAAAELSAPFSERGNQWWARPLRYALEVLQYLRWSFRHEASDRFIERVRDCLLIEESEAFRPLGEHRVSNLELFYGRFLQQLSRGVDIPTLLDELRRLPREESALQTTAINDERLDAVRVMTIHKAKGLTFDTVYVMGMDARPATEDGFSAHVDGLGCCLLGIPDLDYDRCLVRKLRVADAESVRTLYVAMTRPRRRLVLSACLSKKSASTSIAAVPSHLEILRRSGRAEKLEDRLSLLHEQPVIDESTNVRWIWANQLADQHNSDGG